MANTPGNIQPITGVLINCVTDEILALDQIVADEKKCKNPDFRSRSAYLKHLLHEDLKARGIVLEQRGIITSPLSEPKKETSSALGKAVFKRVAPTTEPATSTPMKKPKNKKKRA